jgi:hypothetical protein
LADTELDPVVPIKFAELVWVTGNMFGVGLVVIAAAEDAGDAG